LIQCLADSVTGVRQVAAIALGTTRSDAAFEPLERALGGEAPELRFQAATSIAEVDPERAREPLLRALAVEKDGEVLAALALALAAVGEQRAREPLAALLHYPKAHTRFDIAYGLARLGDGRATPVLLTFLADGEHTWDAIEGLELCGDPRAVEPLAALLQRRFAPREYKLRAAAALLHSGADGELSLRARAELLRGLSAWKYHLRALSVELLGRAGGAWAVPALREAAASRRCNRLGDEIAATVARIEAEP
jgi:HEAT repeat protein